MAPSVAYNSQPLKEPPSRATAGYPALTLFQEASLAEFHDDPVAVGADRGGQPG